MTTAEAIFGLVGNTPLVPIRYRNPNVSILAKLEYYNPSGSVKDRAAKAMIKHAIEHHLLHGRVIIDATSGNTGIALAMMGAAMGMEVELALPANASIERKRILANYGARVHLTDPLEGTDGAQRTVAELVLNAPDRYFYPDQYNNEQNWIAHFTGTAVEIWQETNGTVTHFVAGLGTSGTFMGTARYLSPKGVACVAVQPDNPLHGLEGWKHMATTSLLPGIYDPAEVGQTIEVETEEAFRYAHAACRYLGLPLSPSSAANLAAAVRIADGLDRGVVVTVFPDSFVKYLQESFWDDSAYRIDNPFF